MGIMYKTDGKMKKNITRKSLMLAAGLLTLLLLLLIKVPSVSGVAPEELEPTPDVTETAPPEETQLPPDDGTPTPDISEPTEEPPTEEPTEAPPTEQPTEAPTSAPTTAPATQTEVPPQTEEATLSPTPTSTTEATPTPALEFLPDFTPPPYGTGGNDIVITPQASPDDTQSASSASIGIVQVEDIDGSQRGFRWFDIILYAVDVMYVLSALAIVYGLVGLIGLIVFKKDISIAAFKKWRKRKRGEVK